MASSLIANLSTRCLTNIFEVANTRIVKDLVFCKPSECLSPSKPLDCPQCLPSRNLFSVARFLVEKNGPAIALNGLTFGLGTGVVRTLTFFPTYEFSKWNCLLLTSSQAVSGGLHSPEFP